MRARSGWARLGAQKYKGGIHFGSSETHFPSYYLLSAKLVFRWCVSVSMIASMTKFASLLMIMMSTIEGYKAVQMKDAAHDEGLLSLGGTDHKVAYAVDAFGALTATDSLYVGSNLTI